MLGNIHDSFFKSLFSVKENLKDLLQGTLPPEILNQVHSDTLEYDPTEYVDTELSAYFRDIAFNVSYGEKQIKISLLYEHKSNPDRHIHQQLLRYMLNVWENQADNKLELTPVVCIVFYHGKRKWIHRELLKETPEELKPYVPLFNFVFFNTRDLDDQHIISHFTLPNVKIGVWLLKHSANLMGYIRDNPALAGEMFKELSHIDKTHIQRIAVYLYTASGTSPEIIDQIMENVSPKAKDALEEARLKMINEGMEKGIEKIVLNMIRKGFSDIQINEATNLNIKKIQIIRANNPV